MSKKNGTQVNGFKTVSTCAIHLNFTERNFKVLNDTHTKFQVNQFNTIVILRLVKRRLIFGNVRFNFKFPVAIKVVISLSTEDRQRAPSSSHFFQRHRTSPSVVPITSKEDL